jgi:hypothetical protein
MRTGDRAVLTATATKRPPIVMYEDREDSMVGVKLTILSLARHAPDLEVLVTLPSASAQTRRWVEDQPNATLADVDLELSGWDVKPALLSAHLRAGHESVVWLDGDVIVDGDLQGLLDRAAPQALLVSEDLWWGQTFGPATYRRTDDWGLPRGRLTPFVANTAILRVTADHLPLLAAWQELLERPDYRAAQSGTWASRPVHFAGDQDALTAVLSSAGWEHVEVAAVRSGSEIVHCVSCGAFTPTERLMLWRGRRKPVLVHAASKKPWQTIDHGGSFLGQASAKAHDVLSPYSLAALTYRDQLPSEEVDWSNLEPGRQSWLVQKLSGGNAVLAELPWSFYDATRMQVHRVLAALTGRKPV